ncbi:MAG: amidohydrolase family protein [Acidobacteria bacterium]|nr:amidohydrolase family protein [Acidobacteriota bacterium]
MPDRRNFLAASLATAVAGGTAAAAEPAPIPIIDSHFHIYDQTRPQGAPFPFVPNQPPFLPKDFRASAVPLGIVGGIKVEASPWVEDNLWVLMMIESEPMIVGMVGNLDPVKPEFREYLDRYRKNKLFLGIRYGNVWKEHNMVEAVHKPEFIDNMKAFADTGLTLEVANPRLDLTEAALRLSDKVPALRIVMGHQQALALPGDAQVLKTYESNLRDLKSRGAFVKISGLYRAANTPAGTFPDYKPVMDFLWDIFGEDRAIFAGRNKTVLQILRSYCDAKSATAAEKYFWKNSVLAFRWTPRAANQPRLA